MKENMTIDEKIQEFEKVRTKALVIMEGMKLGSFPGTRQEQIAKLDQAINTMGQIGRAALVALKNRRQTIAVTFDENRPDTLVVTVKPDPEPIVIKAQLDRIIEALELARNADHINGN